MGLIIGFSMACLVLVQIVLVIIFIDAVINYFVKRD